MPIFLNSPMAVDVAAIYRRHPDEDRLEADEIARMYSLATEIHSVDESKLLNLRGGPMVIISQAACSWRGILHHLVAYGPDHRNAIVFTVPGRRTRGSSLLAGERSLRIFGSDVPIRAEVVAMDTMSAHADADGLLSWMGAVADPPEWVYVTHGERPAADTLRARISRELGWPVPGTGASRAGGAGMSVARDARHSHVIETDAGVRQEGRRSVSAQAARRGGRD